VWARWVGLTKGHGLEWGVLVNERWKKQNESDCGSEPTDGHFGTSILAESDFEIERG